MEPCDQERILTIEWEMLDKNRFITLGFANTVALRSLLYPLTVIKTRLQIQKHNEIYKGGFDAFKKILKTDGFTGLYRGYMINTMQIVSGIGYLMTLEKMKHIVSKYTQDNKIKGLIAGGTSSIISQTITTPFDVVSQHIMVFSLKKNNLVLKENLTNNLKLDCLTIKTASIQRLGLNLSIIQEIYKMDGLKGFYRGYFASLSTFVPSSAMWWMFYPCYSENLCNILPKTIPQLSIYCLAGILSGASVATITNVLDVLRVNIQVQRITFRKALKILWVQEKYYIFCKGLSARLTQNCISSCLITLGYEILKRLSLNEEYKNRVKW